MKKFLLVSDIHASTVDPTSPQAPSYVSTASRQPGWIDPLDDLERLVSAEGLRPDFLLCPGDITNKSDPVALAFAWGRLNDIAQRLGAELIATVGNHDVDSRFQGNKFDPRGTLMMLNPRLPVDERTRYLEFWAENFTVLTFADTTVVSLNTAAYHGGGEEPRREIEHGRISEITLSRLERALSNVPASRVNVLLCHHHPIKGEPSDAALVGLTPGGEHLIQALEATRRPWLIVHGHKHIPDLFYGHGGTNAPVVFACASFSAQVNADAQNKNPNQVHFLECDPDGATSAGLTSAGTIRSWTWQPGIGWQRSRGQVGLPHEIGYGYRGNLEVLVDGVETLLRATGSAFASWSSAVAAVPSLTHLMPVDLEGFFAALEARGLGVLTDRDGSLAQIGRTT